MTRSITYRGYSANPITIPDLDVRPEGAEMYSPGCIVLAAQVDVGLPLTVQLAIHADGHVVVRGYEWTNTDNSYLHVYIDPGEHNKEWTATDAQRRTIWRWWAGKDRLPELQACGIGATTQALIQRGVDYSIDEVQRRYLDGQQIALA